MAYHLTKRRKKKFKLAHTKNIALILMIADQKGFFYDHGLDIEYIEVPHALKGMELLLEEKVDASVLVEINFAYLGYYSPKKPVKAFASLEKRTADDLLVHGKNVQPEDIRGKTIGFTPRTTSHSFITKFLEHHDIPKRDVTLKPYNPLAIPNAFIRGEIDAASLWQPNTYNTIIAMKELGRPYTHFKNTGFHTSEVILGTHKSTLVKNSDQIKRLLKTLKEAEDFLVNNPETAHKIIAEKMKISGPKSKISSNKSSQDWHQSARHTLKT